MSLKSYFNGVADVLAARAIVAGESNENIDIGTNREVICENFLNKHIPGRFSVNKGGDIFGISQPKSGQIDIVIAHDISISFQENHKSQFPIESVTSAISVKSNLTSAELKNSLKNLASIPQPSETVVSLGVFNKTFLEYAICQPALFIFAYKGIKRDTCMRSLEEFYTENSVSFNRVPRGIIVLNEYILFYPHYNKGGATANDKYDNSLLVHGDATGDSRGSALFWMLIEIAKGLSWLDSAYLDFGDYYAEAFK